MEHITEVPVGTFPTERFESVLSPERYQEFQEGAERARALFEGRVIWNVNSTPQGGGVAEMLRSLLAYTRALGVDARWIVIDGNPDFFAITKRIHNHLHGAEGDGGPLGEDERRVYEEVTRGNSDEFVELVQPDDVVLVHDPQPAGLVEAVKNKGATVIWRCHVGIDMANDLARKAWNFLLPYVTPADVYVFSREAYTWEGLDKNRVVVVAPSIDAFSPKNQELSEDAIDSILSVAEVVPNGADANPTFIREDGSPSRVDRVAKYYDGGAPPPPGAPLVVQVSRWDRLKDPVGVLQGFAEFVAPHSDAHLILAGPSVEAVADDPEGAEVLNESRDAWNELPSDVKGQVHLATLPMEDGEENAAIVNAIQRKAAIVVQKSIAEGFGLTVAEGMWKARPVVASRIGGIQDQIEEGVSGCLIDDPHDLKAYGEAVRGLLEDPERAERIGQAARERVRNQFLGPRHLLQYLALIGTLLDGKET
ncbi:MAG: glycosyltransferase [Actinomycetota bacterium]|nr:glycosyltransferase [Actinomycetota bacterium]